MDSKLIYETPLAELILVRFEENILSGIENGTTPSYNGDFGTEQDWDQ